MVNLYDVSDSYKRQGRVQQPTGQLLDNFNPYPVEQNGSDCNRCHFVLLGKD